MRGVSAVVIGCAALAALAVPAGANADATWSCSASAGSASGKAPVLGGDPCPVADAAAGSAAGINADGRALMSKLRTRKNPYLAKRLRGLDEADLATLDRAAEILEDLLEGERR